MYISHALTVSGNNAGIFVPVDMRFGVLAVEVIADEAIAAGHCGHGSRGNELIEHVGQALV